MRTKNIALIALTIMLSIHIQRIEACTRAVYIGPDNLIVTGRTMDWKEDIMSNLYVFPRGIQRAGYNKGETVTWTSKYGSVIATGYDIGTCDGMNEKGLVASLLFLPESVYKRLGDKRPVMGISIWTQYVLDNFATVREAVDELKKEIFRIDAPRLSLHFTPGYHRQYREYGCAGVSGRKVGNTRRKRISGYDKLAQIFITTGHQRLLERDRRLANATWYKPFK